MSKLSPGTRWQDKLKLKDEADVVSWRAWWLRRGQQNRRVRESLIDACKHDILFYTNLFVWQYNPKRLGAEVGPFWTWPFQDKAFPQIVGCIEDQVNQVCQKSREMGLSWMYLIVADWLCRFHPHKQVLLISRSAEAVESESPNSLFWKVDFLHDHLPEWLHQPENFRNRVMYRGYPSGSSITGEASTGRAGVGGRATAIFIDEFPQIRDDWEVLHRTSDTADCRFVNGTHLGTGTAFFKLCNDKAAFPPRTWRRLLVHWTEHPLKAKGLYRYNDQTNLIETIDKSYVFPPDFEFVRRPAPTGGPFPGIRSPWYDKACEAKGNNSRAIAMDLDVDPQGSSSQVFNALTLASLKRQHCVGPYWEGDLKFNPVTGEPVSPPVLVKQEGGPLRLWLYPEGNRVRRGKYKIGADLSTGNGATNSCLAIIDAELSEKVGSYTTPNLKPDKIALVGLALCQIFQDHYKEGAELIWECPGPGLDFSDVVIKSGYRHVYWRKVNKGNGPRIYEKDSPDLTPGWYQSPDGKRFLVSNYCTALEDGKYLTREEEELRECLDFRWAADGRTLEHALEESKDDPSGARLNHGDRVIATALAWHLASDSERFRPKEQEEETGPPPGSLAWRRALGEYRQEEEERAAWGVGTW